MSTCHEGEQEQSVLENHNNNNEEEDDLSEEDTEPLDQIRRIMNQNNEVLLDHLKQRNKRQVVSIEGLKSNVTELNQKVDQIEKQLTDQTHHQDIQALTRRVDENKTNADHRMDEYKKEHKKLTKKISGTKKKLDKEIKELKQKLFEPQIPNNPRSKDFNALSLWMIENHFSDPLREKLFENNILSFDLLRKHVSSDYLVHLDSVHVPLGQIPEITRKIKEITSADIAEYTQKAACKDAISAVRTVTTVDASFFEPRHDRVQLTNDDIPRSYGARKLYDETAKITGELEDIRVNFEDCKCNENRQYNDIIRDFITMNHVDNIDADKIQIRMGRRMELPPSSGTRKQKQEELYVFTKLSGLISIKTCRKSHAVLLKGKKGVYAKKPIPEGTVLGEYIGIEFVEKEFEDIFQNAMAKSDHERYSIKKKKTVPLSIKDVQDIICNEHKDEDVEMKSSEMHNRNHNRKKRSYNEMNDGVNDNGGHKRQKLNVRNVKHIKTIQNDTDPLNKKVMQTFIFIVDPLGLKKERGVESMLWEINDCREHLFVDEASDEDEERRNIKCVSCFVNNWPRLFIVADKAIRAGQELLSYCGAGYIDNVMAQQRDNDLKKRLNH